MKLTKQHQMSLRKMLLLQHKASLFPGSLDFFRKLLAMCSTRVSHTNAHTWWKPYLNKKQLRCLSVRKCPHQIETMSQENHTCTPLNVSSSTTRHNSGAPQGAGRTSFSLAHQSSPLSHPSLLLHGLKTPHLLPPHPISIEISLRHVWHLHEHSQRQQQLEQAKRAMALQL